MTKYLPYITLAGAGFLTISGFTGHLSPVAGGLGWLVVAVNSITDIIRNKKEEEE